MSGDQLENQAQLESRDVGLEPEREGWFCCQPERAALGHRRSGGQELAERADRWGERAGAERREQLLGLLGQLGGPEEVHCEAAPLVRPL